MANAAAKKAAAARASAASTYLPIVLGINAVHVLIRLYQWRTFATLPNLLLTVLLWALTGFAYKGIIDDHADSASAKMAKAGGGSKGASGGGGSSEKLAGGASLDLLGLVVVVQYGSALSDRFYWLLAILPFWGGWTMYKTVYGAKEGLMGGGGGGYPQQQQMQGGEEPKVDDAVEERRRKRAERRRMKRA